MRGELQELDWSVCPLIHISHIAPVYEFSKRHQRLAQWERSKKVLRIGNNLDILSLEHASCMYIQKILLSKYTYVCTLPSLWWLSREWSIVIVPHTKSFTLQWYGSKCKCGSVWCVCGGCELVIGSPVLLKGLSLYILLPEESCFSTIVRCNSLSLTMTMKHLLHCS